MIDTVIKNHNGMKWMLMRALNGYADISSMLTGHVYDAETGDPIVAEVIVEERQSKYFTPRKSDEPLRTFLETARAGFLYPHRAEKRL